jgi:hypothetical protein
MNWLKRLATGMVLVGILAMSGTVAVSAKTHHSKTKIEYRIKYRTPKACSTALKDFRTVSTYEGTFDTLMEQYPKMVGSAAEDGIEDNAAGITALTTQMDGITSKTNTLAGEISALTPGLQAAEAKCDGS